jgi:hypothetical protein
MINFFLFQKPIVTLKQIQIFKKPLKQESLGLKLEISVYNPNIIPTALNKLKFILSIGSTDKGNNQEQIYATQPWLDTINNEDVIRIIKGLDNLSYFIYKNFTISLVSQRFILLERFFLKLSGGT